ncbi:unnamed protein product [Prunus armeniaca]|uniref:Uncharacterized protein n=1 Tax=Prunus armeniaca TaxID=36596 RepID=A0A6J5W070_PRUAR|nr:unnamed protein product [Prunus armeniaca]CAB4293297.1 unnamed protein product [Prunus armeniaca]
MAMHYGSHTSDFVVGIGKLLTAFIILASRQRWFNDSINLSRLDKMTNSAIEEHVQGHNGSGNMEMATV